MAHFLYNKREKVKRLHKAHEQKKENTSITYYQSNIKHQTSNIQATSSSYEVQIKELPTHAFKWMNQFLN